MNKIITEDVRSILERDLPWEKLHNSSILITGASGMLASYLVFTIGQYMREHADCGCRLFLAVRNAAKAENRFGSLLCLPGISLVSWDGVSELPAELTPDYIIHAASIADSSLYLTNPVETLTPNVIGTWRLLELARKHPVQGFLFFSSGGAYGKVTGRDVIREEDSGFLLPQEVRSCYGESKRMGENLCASYASEYGVPACAVRISHTYGPTLNLRGDSRVFAEFVRNIVDHEDIVMKSDGSAKRAFCYISDAADAFLRILLCGTPGQVYNMCNDEAFVSIAELAQKMTELFPERKLQVRRIARAAGDTYSENKNANTDVLSTEKLRALGWKPMVSIERGFRRTVLSFEKEKSEA